MIAEVADDLSLEFEHAVEWPPAATRGTDADRGAGQPVRPDQWTVLKLRQGRELGALTSVSVVAR